MSLAEIITAGLQAMTDSAEATLDVHESQAICALAWAVKHGGFEGELTDDQLNWIIAAVRTGYLCGKERREMFKGYG